jgi:hypothetical protein
MNDQDRKRQMDDMRAWYETRVAEYVAERDMLLHANANANQKTAWCDFRIAELERANVALVSERDAAARTAQNAADALVASEHERQEAWLECGKAVRERDAAVHETHRLLDQVANWQRAYDEMKRDRDEAERDLDANKDALADIEIAMNFAGNEMSKVMEERNAARAADLEVRRMQCRPDLVPLDATPDADELAPFGWIPVPKPGQWQPGTTAGKDCRGNVGQGYAAQEREAHDA